jgi:hypothetical protein
MKALALADCTEALCLSAAIRVRILEKSRCTTSRICCKQSAHKLIACHLSSYVIFACPWRTKNVSAAACGDPLWRTLAKNDVEMPGNTDRDNHNFVGLLVALACYQQPLLSLESDPLVFVAWAFSCFPYISLARRATEGTASECI